MNPPFTLTSVSLPLTRGSLAEARAINEWWNAAARECNDENERACPGPAEGTGRKPGREFRPLTPPFRWSLAWGRGPPTQASRGTQMRQHVANLTLSSWGGRTRTSNFPVNSRAVCQLTYTPIRVWYSEHWPRLQEGR